MSAVVQVLTLLASQSRPHSTAALKAQASAHVPQVRLGPARGQAMPGGRGRMGYGPPGASFGRGRGGMAGGGAGRGGRGAFPQRPMAMAGGYQGGPGGRGMMGRGGRGLAGRGPFNAGEVPGRGPCACVPGEWCILFTLKMDGSICVFVTA